MLASDLNGDGKPDLVSVNEGDNSLTVFTNNGAGVFGSNATLVVGSEVQSATIADVNGDGKPDLISADFSPQTLTVYTNTGTGVFGLYNHFPVGRSSSFVIAADVNGDGQVDLVSANQDDDNLTVTDEYHRAGGVQLRAIFFDDGWQSSHADCGR